MRQHCGERAPVAGSPEDSPPLVATMQAGHRVFMGSGAPTGHDSSFRHAARPHAWHAWHGWHEQHTGLRADHGCLWSTGVTYLIDRPCSPWLPYLPYLPRATRRSFVATMGAGPGRDGFVVRGERAGDDVVVLAIQVRHPVRPMTMRHMWRTGDASLFGATHGCHRRAVYRRFSARPMRDRLAERPGGCRVGRDRSGSMHFQTPRGAGGSSRSGTGAMRSWRPRACARGGGGGSARGDRGGGGDLKTRCGPGVRPRLTTRISSPRSGSAGSPR